MNAVVTGNGLIGNVVDEQGDNGSGMMNGVAIDVRAGGVRTGDVRAGGVQTSDRGNGFGI